MTNGSSGSASPTSSGALLCMPNHAPAAPRATSSTAEKAITAHTRPDERTPIACSDILADDAPAENPPVDGPCDGPRAEMPGAEIPGAALVALDTNPG